MTTPVGIDFMFSNRFQSVWKEGRAVSASFPLMHRERALREFDVFEGSLVFTNARLVLLGSKTRSIWFCRIRDVLWPARSEVSGRGIVVKPELVVLADERFLVLCGGSEIDQSVSPEELRRFGLIEGVFTCVAWCVGQHKARPRELGLIGLQHAPECPYAE